MTATKPIEQILNYFFRQAEEVVGFLSLVGVPNENTETRREISNLVGAARRGFEALKTEGYSKAWKDLAEARAVLKSLCVYKDQNFLNVNPDLSRRCEEAYMALPKPEDSPTGLHVSLLNRKCVNRMERIAYTGRIDEPMTLVSDQPMDVTSLTPEQFKTLQVGAQILVRSKEGGQNWYNAVVTKGIFPGSVPPSISFNVTGHHPHRFTIGVQSIYGISDAQLVAYPSTPIAK